MIMTVNAILNVRNIFRWSL